jgi:hypothetical protein
MSAQRVKYALRVGGRVRGEEREREEGVIVSAACLSLQQLSLLHAQSAHRIMNAIVSIRIHFCVHCNTHTGQRRGE